LKTKAGRTMYVHEYSNVAAQSGKSRRKEKIGLHRIRGEFHAASDVNKIDIENYFSSRYL
jgi:hypothetical protein